MKTIELSMAAYFISMWLLCVPILIMGLFAGTPLLDRIGLTVLSQFIMYIPVMIPLKKDRDDGTEVS